jgi:hypothetical protein
MNRPSIFEVSTVMRLFALLAALLPALVATACGGASDASSTTATANDAGTTATDTGATMATDTTSAKDTAGKDAKPAAKCNPYGELSGCPDAQHCVADDDGAWVCVDDGEHGVGEPCDDGKGCNVGDCVQTDCGKSFCTPYCISLANCPVGAIGCNELKGKPGKVCSLADECENCDPFAQAACGPKKGCYDGSSGFTCKDAGSAQLAESCKSSDDCAPGLTCQGSLCRKYCQANKNPPGCNKPETACPKISATVGYCAE